MDNREFQIKQIEERINLLLKQQNSFAKEINALNQEIQALKSKKEPQEPKQIPVVEEKEMTTPKITSPSQPHTTPTSNFKFKLPKEQPSSTTSQETSINMEEFIGGNVLSKVGILITIIGVAIGVKYSIDHNLISPVIRVLLGYIFGLSLVGIAFKLKPKYFTYSAVLLSGAVTMLYFITFFSYSIYQLFPQVLTFLIMVAITLFTVFSALSYNRQIIAHLGLVGAYAVPFLLSDGSGRVGTLLFYMTLINLGILSVSYFKNWKSLIYSSFGLSWFILSAWVLTEFTYSDHFYIGLIYTLIFFLTFYSILLVNKIINREEFSSINAALLLLNSFLFYGLVMYMLHRADLSDQFGGLFTLATALFHGLVSAFLYRQKLPQQHLFYFIVGISIAFFTISIPVQLDGNWVTISWIAEAVLLFTFGRIRKNFTIENLSYPLILIAFISLVSGWGDYNTYYSIQHPEDKIPFLFNTLFLTTFVAMAGYGFINFIWQKRSISPIDNPFHQLMSFVVPGLFIFTSYMSFRLEIDNRWHQLFIDSTVDPTNVNDGHYRKNTDLLHFSSIWIINYSLLFFGSLSLFNYFKVKNQLLYPITALLILGSILVFLTEGLYDISELRESYLNPNFSYPTNSFHLLVRYLSYPFVFFALYTIYQSVRAKQLLENAQMYFDLLLTIVVVWVLSSELIGILNLAGFNNSYKLGLSILWGIYALTMISLGIFQQKKHLRVAAIALFGFTLVKLFFYDISHLGTIQKTVVLVSLGVLLLVISFLYNKFKDNINAQ